MRITVQRLILFLVGVVVCSSAFALAQNIRAEQGPAGILLLAHGGKKKWNRDVKSLAAQVNGTIPTEVAFGMADSESIQAAVDRLAERGVHQIAAVPLFVSSHSSVVAATQYLLGLRAEAPPALAMFAGMRHDSAGHMEMGPGSPDARRTTPIKSPVPIRMTSALDHSPLVADILVSRAQRLSKDPARETVVLVAHGPVSDQENARWLADMNMLADLMKRSSGFKQLEVLTVRDDAPEPVRSQATAELRRVVERANRQGNRVLVIPLLISYGGIEKGIKKRLAGLRYVMTPQGLLPDNRLAEWVLEQARSDSVASP
jgi:sirohydrochlorin cobaltochelatase